MKNGNRKDKLIRSVNLGKPGEPARELIEIYERKYGTGKISKLVREMIVRELSRKKEFDGYKIRQLKEERNFLQDHMKEVHKKILYNSERLEKLGVDITTID